MTVINLPQLPYNNNNSNSIMCALFSSRFSINISSLSCHDTMVLFLYRQPRHRSILPYTRFLWFCYSRQKPSAIETTQTSHHVQRIYSKSIKNSTNAGHINFIAIPRISKEKFNQQFRSVSIELFTCKVRRKTIRQGERVARHTMTM